jgi:uncharacterized membrane protein
VVIGIFPGEKVSYPNARISFAFWFIAHPTLASCLVLSILLFFVFVCLHLVCIFTRGQRTERESQMVYSSQNEEKKSANKD